MLWRQLVRKERGVCRKATEAGSQGRSRFRGHIVWVGPGPQSWANLETSRNLFRVSQTLCHCEVFKFYTSSVTLYFHRLIQGSPTSCPRPVRNPVAQQEVNSGWEREREASPAAPRCSHYHLNHARHCSSHYCLNHLPASVEKMSSTKLVPGAKKLGTAGIGLPQFTMLPHVILIRFQQLWTCHLPWPQSSTKLFKLMKNPIDHDIMYLKRLPFC